jgi:hypothetical protein
MPEPVLFRWPLSAALGRTVPKARFYEHGNVRTAVREKFVNEVQRITWSYKLAEDTIRLGGTAAVPEIQVFTIDTKGEDVTDDVLHAIDKTVHFPIIFEVASKDRVRTSAAQKSLSGKAPSIGGYFSSDWLSADAPRRPMPTALDLPALYEAVLTTLLPSEKRVGESVSDATYRLEHVRKLQREVAALEKKLRSEPQLNRRVRLRREIKERIAVLAELTAPSPSNKELP